MHLLETSGLTKRFGGLTVMNDLDFSMEEGEIKGFLGPNGAGKSTFFNLITGVLTPSSGHIFYAGKEITKSKPHQVAKMGIGRTFQLNPLFGEFTVFENVTAAYHLRPHSTVPQVFFNTKTYRQNEEYIAKSADEVLEFLGLQHVRNELAKNLPHGYQKILGVARALATKPKLLLLDEPLGGMNPEEIAFSIDAISLLKGYRWPGNIRQLKNVAETVTALESRPATLESERIELGARELAPYIPDEKDTLLPQIASPAATGGSMAEEDKRVLVKALLDLKGEVDALTERVKALEGGTVRQIPEQAGSDRLVGRERLGAENDDDAEWQEQSEELSIRKNTGELIEKALEKHGGNVKAAAAELGISERTVYRKLAKNKK